MMMLNVSAILMNNSGMLIRTEDTKTITVMTGKVLKLELLYQCAPHMFRHPQL